MSQWAGAGTGALTGAGTGAAVGTAFMPGIGTGIGAGVGGLIGGVTGYFGSQGAPEYTPPEYMTPEQSAAYMQSLAGALGVRQPADFRGQQQQAATAMLDGREHQARIGSDQRFADRGLYRSGGAGAQQRGIGQAYDQARQQASTSIDQNYQQQQSAYQQMMMQAAMANAQQQNQRMSQDGMFAYQTGPYSQWKSQQDMMAGQMGMMGNVLPSVIPQG